MVAFALNMHRFFSCNNSQNNTTIYIALHFIGCHKYSRNDLKYVGGCVRLYANTLPFYIRDLSILKLCYLQGCWNQSARETER